MAFIDWNDYLIPGEDICFMYNIPGVVEVQPWYYITSYGRIFSTSKWRINDGPVREMSRTFASNGYL